MAIEPAPSGNWPAAIATRLSDVTGETIPNRASLLVIPERRRRDELEYADACEAHSLWLGPHRRAIGLRARRVYFVRLGGEIDRRPERMIVGARRPEPLSPAKQVYTQHAIARELSGALDHARFELTSVVSVGCNLAAGHTLRIGAMNHSLVGTTLDQIYREHGFDEVPTSATCSVCPLDGAEQEHAVAFAKRLARVAKARGLELRLHVRGPEAAEKRLIELEGTGEAPRPGMMLVILLPFRAKPCSSAAARLLHRLDRAGVPYRRAYVDDPQEFSIPDQVPSILAAVGGRAHRPAAVVRDGVWLVGVDLSHPASRRHSTLAVTLVDSKGGLRGAWTRRQRLDETPRPESLRQLLLACREGLSRLEVNAEVLVVRDGRLFENEDANLYQSVLGARTTLVELRKNGNPLIVNGHDVEGPPLAPAVVAVENCNTLFLAARSPVSPMQLPTTAKLHWDEKFNGLGLSKVELGDLVLASTGAPTLGNRPSLLPSPIYWADGIAGASDDDLRFRGQGAIDLTPAAGCD